MYHAYGNKNENGKKTNILIVEDHSAPYRDETFAKTMEKGCRIAILTEKRADAHGHKEWQYTSPVEAYREYAKCAVHTRIGAYRRGLLKKVRFLRPDAVCTGSMLEGLAVKLSAGYPVRIVRCSDTMKQGRHGSWRSNRLLLTWLYRTADAVWVPGKAAKKYYSGYFRDTGSIWQGCYTRDARRLAADIAVWRTVRLQEKKKAGFLETNVVFLFIGKLIRTRRVEILLRAAEQMESVYPQVRMLIIGDGEMESQVTQYVKRHDNVVHIPQVPVCELEKYYAIADAYVHPGGEPYSVALYEAAVAGIPVIASKEAGAAADCLRDGSNGYYFAYGDPRDLFQKMVQVMEHRQELQTGAARVSAFIKRQRGTEWSASQLMQACGIME